MRYLAKFAFGLMAVCSCAQHLRASGAIALIAKGAITSIEAGSGVTVPPTVGVGTRFTVFAAYDPNITPSFLSSTLAQYNHQEGPGGMGFIGPGADMGGLNDIYRIVVSKTPGLDSLILEDDTSLPGVPGIGLNISNLIVTSLVMTLSGPSGILPNLGLPTRLPGLSAFSTAQFTITAVSSLPATAADQVVFHGDIDSLTILGGPSCNSSVSQAVDNVDINNDGFVDLVADRASVVRIVGCGTDPSAVQVVFLNSSGTSTLLTDSFVTGDEIDFSFTPSSATDLGKGMIETTDSSGNQQTVSVDVKPVRGVRYAYHRVDYLDATPNFVSTVANSGDYIKAVYPVGSDFTQKTHSIYIPLPQSFDPTPRGAVFDAFNLWLQSQLDLFLPERAIGVVPRRWFVDHLLGLNTIGSKFPGIPVAFVLDGQPLVTAHELGHSYGFLLHTNFSTTGFWVQRQLEVEAKDYMFLGLTQQEQQLPYPTQGTIRWTSSDHFGSLFRQFRTQTNDPEVLLVTGLVNRSGAVTIPFLYRTFNGRVDQSTTGDGAVQVLDSTGNALTEVGFATDFSVTDADPPVTLDSAPFALAVPYPPNATSVRIVIAGQVMADINVTTKLLHDAVDSIPDAAYSENPEQRRNALFNKIDALDSQLNSRDLVGARNKLGEDIRKHLDDWLVDGYAVQSPVQYAKSQILALIGELLARF